MSETFVADVKQFTELAGCTVDQFNARQTALYIGLQLEEMSEKMDAIGSVSGHKVLAVCSGVLQGLSDKFKDGSFDVMVKGANRQNLLDADVDLAWVTIGSMLSQGANVLGAMGEVARANLAKFPDGVVTKDENGKVVKPVGWVGPDLAPFVA